MVRLVPLIALLALAAACGGPRLVPPGARVVQAPLDEEGQAYPEGPPWCFSEDSTWVAYELGRLQGQVAPSAAPDARVALVTDEAICHSISVVLDSSFFLAPRRQPVVVYWLPANREALFRDVRYVVAVPPLLRGEFGAHAHLDEALRVFDAVYLR